MKRILFFISLTIICTPLLAASTKPRVEVEDPDDAHQKEILNHIGGVVASFAHLVASDGGHNNADPNLIANFCQQLFGLFSTAIRSQKEFADLLLTPEGKKQIERMLYKKIRSIKN